MVGFIKIVSANKTQSEGIAHSILLEDKKIGLKQQQEKAGAAKI